MTGTVAVAVIPARGGSRRIPRKNIRLFAGRPMISYAIDCALRSGVFDKVIVSTDDAEVSAIATQCGAEVPFTRPAALSDDHAGTADVMIHAVDHCLAAGMNLTAACCIYPTAPFVRPEDVARGLEMLESTDLEFVFAATTFAYPIFRSFRRREGGGLEMIFPEVFHARSQDLPEAMHDAGQFYWGSPAAWRDSETAFGTSAGVIAIPRWRVQDIDTEEDWIQAEAMAPAIVRQMATESRHHGEPR